MSKLGIEPIEISVNVLAIYDQGIIYEKAVLDVNQEEYINNLKLAYNQSIKLAEEIGYICKDNIDLLLTKAQRNALILSKELKIEINTEIPKTIKVDKIEEIKEEKPEMKDTGFVGYTKEVEEKAQDILRGLQDKKIQELEKPKHKSMWD